MASPSEQPWSDHEKNHLLAEIIKASNPQPTILLELIARQNIQPRWDDIPLPPGRSLNSSRLAYEHLWRSPRPPLGSSLGPQTPTPMSAPIPALKRPYGGFEAPFSAGPSGREIRPKPSAAGASMPLPSPTEPPTKRKRGRPTKAEALAKAEAAAVAGTGLTPSFARRAPPVAHGPVTTMPAREVKPSPAPTTAGMPIASMLTPTHGTQQSGASHSSSSSGKRRARARSAKSEPADTMVGTSSAVELEYESPYARMGLGGSGDRGGPASDDSPAAALTRRQDETALSPTRRASTHPGTSTEKPRMSSSPRPP